MEPTDPIAFDDRAALQAWLELHGDDADELWIKLAKKASGHASVSYVEAVEVALCYGWIDGLAKGLDEDWHAQRFTPRRARSNWSKLNRARAEALIESGEMRPAGLREIERARADGRWDAADGAQPPTRPTQG